MAESVRESLNKGHIPVLLWETVSLLSPADGRIYLDCTFGAGGHSRAILQSANCHVEALDRDPDAAVRAPMFRTLAILAAVCSAACAIPFFFFRCGFRPGD